MRDNSNFPCSVIVNDAILSYDMARQFNSRWCVVVHGTRLYVGHGMVWDNDPWENELVQWMSFPT